MIGLLFHQNTIYYFIMTTNSNLNGGLMQLCHCSLVIFFHVGFFADTENLQDSRKGGWLCSSLFLPFIHKHSGIYLEFFIWDGYLSSLIAVPLITKLVLYEVYQPLTITIRLNVDFLSDLIAAIFHRQALHLNQHQLSSCYCKWNSKPSLLSTLILATFVLRNRSILG